MLDIADECISTMWSKISHSWGANKKPTRLFLFLLLDQKFHMYIYYIYSVYVCMCVYIYTHTHLCVNQIELKSISLKKCSWKSKLLCSFPHYHPSSQLLNHILKRSIYCVYAWNFVICLQCSEIYIPSLTNFPILRSPQTSFLP